MMLLRRIIIAMLMLQISSLVYSQIKLPSVEAQSLFAFDRNNISLYSGGSSTSVPLYTIKSFVNIPISINYNGGHGIKVREHASRVGLGWTLNAAQCISKVIKGLHDSGSNGFHQYDGTDWGDNGYIDWNKSPSSDEIYNMDYEPDLHYFSTLSRSGTFYRDKNNRFIQLPLSQVKIEGKFDRNTGEFVITETNGVKYYFSETETTKNEIMLPGQEGNAEFLSSSCYLKRIVSADGCNTINFFYKDGLERVYNYDNSGEPMVIVPDTEVLGYPESYSETRTKILDYISWNEGSLQFIYSNERKDLIGGVFLRSILLKNKEKKTIKSFAFDYSYFGRNRSYALNQVANIDKETKDKGSELRLKLDAVHFLDAKGDKVSSYRMEYNTRVWLPERSSYAIDHWGYYNGARNNNNLCPLADLNPDRTVNSMNVADRSTNSLFSPAGTLKKIIYPTGGYSEFIYESNSVAKKNLDRKRLHLFSKNIWDTESTHKKCKNEQDHDYLYETREDTLDCRKIIGNKKVVISLYNYPTTSNAVFITFKNLETEESETITINEKQRYYFLKKAGKYKVSAHSNQKNLTQRWDLSFSWLIMDADSKINFDVGGLRIAEIRNSNGKNKVQTKYYKYEEADKSTGHLVEKPEYVYVKDNRLPGNIFANLFYLNNTIYPLRLTKGSVVGYSKVTEYEKGNGKEEYQFSTAYIFPDVAYSSFKTPPHKNSIMLEGYGEVPFFPLSEKQSYETFRGLLLNVKKYKELAVDNYELQREVKNYYYIYTLCSNQNIIDKNFALFKESSMFPEACKTIKGQKIRKTKNTVYGIEYFLYALGTYKQKTVQIDYYGRKNVNVENEYRYNNTGQIITERQLSSAGIIEKEYQYPEKGHLLYGLNQIEIPISKKVRRNNLLISETNTEYATFNDKSEFIFPSKLKEANINGSHNVDSYTDVLQYLRYNKRGKPIVLLDKNGIQTVFVWGKNQNYPVAKIANANYKQIYENVSLLSKFKKIDEIKGLKSQEERMKLRKLNEDIRKELATSNVTTLTYIPLLGAESKTDLNGLTTYYDYDLFGRLLEIRNFNNELVSQYSYNYAKLELTLSLSNLNFTSKGRTKQLRVISNQNWVVSSDKSWLKLDKISGSKNEIINITCLSNTGVERNAILKVKTGNIIRYVDVKQEAGISLSVNPKTIHFQAIALDPQFLNIKSKSNWTISSNVKWILCDKNSGKGNESVRIMVDSNPFDTVRKATITVCSSQESRIVNITQDGAINSGGPGKTRDGSGDTKRTF
jgi:hypothetical protein